MKSCTISDSKIPKESKEKTEDTGENWRNFRQQDTIVIINNHFHCDLHTVSFSWSFLFRNRGFFVTLM